MANVLCRVEDAEGQCVQKVTWTEETHDRTNGEASAVLEETRHLFQLWNIRVAVTTVLLQQREHVLMLTARMGLVELGQLAIHCAPAFDFRGCVVDMRDLLTSAVDLGLGRDFSTSLTVDWVMRTGVVRAELLTHGKDLVRKRIEIRHLTREPWHAVYCYQAGVRNFCFPRLTKPANVPGRPSAPITRTSAVCF